MKITLDLPEYDNPGHREYETDGYDHIAGLCAGCGHELFGLTVRIHPHGFLHAEKEEDGDGRTCQERFVEKLLADPATAWLTIARHVAKYPSKHNTSAIRTVITALVKLAETAGAR